MKDASAALPAKSFETRSRAPAKTDSPRAAALVWPVAIMGVPFDNVTLTEAVERIEAMIASRQPHYVVTANVDFLVQARRDVELRRMLLEADLMLCDGMPLVWASRWLGRPLRERVAGSDLAPHLLQVAAAKGYRIFLLGAAAGVAAEAAERLCTQHPDLQLAGHYAPPFNNLLAMDHEEIARRIREAQPDILFVALGCPKQEKWMGMHYRRLGVPVVMGVGATLDFLAGRAKRAPLWMRQSGAEWIYRLWQEPRRLFRRYFKDVIYFFPELAAQWACLRSPFRLAPAFERHISFMPKNWIRAVLGRQITRSALERDAGLWQTLMSESCHCQLDLSRVRRIDSTGLAILVHWRKQLRSRQRELVLLAPSAAVRRTLRRTRLDDYFFIADDPAQACSLVETAASRLPVELAESGHPLVWQSEITAANADQVWQLTADYLVKLSARHTALVIDLSQVRFIDSTGVGLMLRVKKSARELEMDVSFAGAQPAVRNVLDLTQLDWLLHRDKK
ncbi:MAG: WecB/TagA/CpsF family glycosyltransferase [Verrucomicrobiota bacterium]|nr:WecB/TagA/CpsF family glycosyltransferase [Verrucomicrobiota bacterium]